MQQTAQICRESNPGDRFVHPADPHSFLLCQPDGHFIIFACPHNLFFNSDLDRCFYTPETINTPCDSSPCLGAASKCVNVPANKTYTCECAAGYSGVNCELAADPCEAQPCGEDGVCNTLGPYSPIGYYCTCANERTFGLSCDNDLADNERNPCIDDPVVQQFATALHPTLYVQCQDDGMMLRTCPRPLAFSAETMSCDLMDINTRLIALTQSK